MSQRTIPTSSVSAARVITPERVLEPGWVSWVGDSIVEVGAGQVEGAQDLGDVTLAPGFVDMHAHGGGGAAFTDGPDAARAVLETHLAQGTTSMMASLVTDTIDNLERQVRDLAPMVLRGELLGIHLEGPWLSHLHRGAHQESLLRDPEPEDIDRLLAAGGGAIAMVTLAVERQGGIEATRRFVENGVIVAPGHSHATYERAVQAIEAGASVATHLFNAERPIHHREPGLIVALLEQPQVSIELIADGVHVHPAMLREAARRAQGRFVLVTDAMAAAGSADGDYELGPLQVRVQDGIARLVDGGAIAGSTLTLDRAVRYATGTAGIGLHEAITAATSTPADVLRRPDLGRLAPGARADLVVLDAQLRVGRVMRAGKWVR
ncbi:N-acetylglucosamine-6-phosphate deacetylase [Gephyromycinifex aptenodytis]|uniref:N-acetylglucosamine-6-phosphate deacetylase n=1 Tax=Gephyromycinifex aptenodytis TaxID=2716227 RepID=UPI001D016C31|nr:N-acetylglucosamine-6-phosphate deacetylase [Gephyromycinifex aptenodytis]